VGGTFINKNEEAVWPGGEKRGEKESAEPLFAIKTEVDMEKERTSDAISQKGLSRLGIGGQRCGLRQECKKKNKKPCYFNPKKK